MKERKEPIHESEIWTPTTFRVIVDLQAEIKKCLWCDRPVVSGTDYCKYHL